MYTIDQKDKCLECNDYTIDQKDKCLECKDFMVCFMEGFTLLPSDISNLH